MNFLVEEYLNFGFQTKKLAFDAQIQVKSSFCAWPLAVKPVFLQIQLLVLGMLVFV